MWKKQLTKYPRAPWHFPFPWQIYGAVQLDLANTVVSGSVVSLLSQGSEGLLSLLHLYAPPLSPFPSPPPVVTLCCDGSITGGKPSPNCLWLVCEVERIVRSAEPVVAAQHSSILIPAERTIQAPCEEQYIKRPACSLWSHRDTGVFLGSALIMLLKTPSTLPVTITLSSFFFTVRIDIFMCYYVSPTRM